MLKEDGGAEVNIRTSGDVKITEIETILSMAKKHWAAALALND